MFHMPDGYDSWRLAEPDRLAPEDDDPDEENDMGQIMLLETFAVTVPGQPAGVEFKGELWTTPHRSTGRRIRVVAAGAVIVFDSDDCYDLGNARNALDNWLATQQAAAEKKLAPTLAGDSHRRFLSETDRLNAQAIAEANTGDGAPVG